MPVVLNSGMSCDSRRTDDRGLAALFTDAVSALEDKLAVKLLPAYLKRDRVEEKSCYVP